MEIEIGNRDSGERRGNPKKKRVWTEEISARKNGVKRRNQKMLQPGSRKAL